MDNSSLIARTRPLSRYRRYLSLLTQDREHFTTLYNERLMMRQNEMAATQAALDALQQARRGRGGVQRALCPFGPLVK